MGLLDKLVSAVKDRLGVMGGAETLPGLSNSQLSQIHKALEPLNTALAGLGDRAAKFTIDGTEESVLLELERSHGTALGTLLGKPGRLRWGFNSNDKKLETMAYVSMANRASFYGSVNDATSLDALVRFGKVLAVADAGKSLEHPGASIPDWLQYLVNDALFSSIKANQHEKVLATHRANWDVRLIARLLLNEGLDERLALAIVFERKGLDNYYHYHDPLDHLLNSDALPEYLRQHPDWVTQLPSSLSAAGRVQVVRKLGNDKNLLADFAPVMAAMAVDSSKTVRNDAVKFIEGIAEAQRVALLQDLMTSGDSTQRAQAAELMARLPAEAGRAALEAALAAEASKPVQQALLAALSRLDAVDDAGEQIMPTTPEWQAFSDLPLGPDALALLQENLAEMRQKSKAAAEQEVLANKDQKHSHSWAKHHYDSIRKIGEGDLQLALQLLNGTRPAKDRHSLRAQNVVMHAGKIYALPEFGPAHLIRWVCAAHRDASFWGDAEFQKWLARQTPGTVDLRALAAFLQSAKLSPDLVAVSALCNHWSAPSAVDLLPPERIWPFFMDHPHYIDEGLGLAQTRKEALGFELGATLNTLAIFPVLPKRWLPRLMELALGEGKTYRAAAQKALASLPDLGRRVLESLSHSKSEVRIEAAQWLANMRYGEAVSALIQALTKESRETVRAALLTALESLGQDINAYLAPNVLSTEAKQGLKAKPPAGLSWFGWDALPACQWADGASVEPEIVRWWVVLAAKLKEAGGNALLNRYLGLLAPASARALSASVLRQFIAQDVRRPGLDAGIAFAQANAPARYQYNQNAYLDALPAYREYYAAEYAKSEEQVFEECKRAKMAEYLGSAIGEKGILALAARVPGADAVALLQQYMRDHYQRRAQIEAMLEAVAAGTEPVVIQLLLGVSRRYRTASVQEKARALVQEIAQRNHWSAEQLADRTIPTAGLDDTGALQLEFGSRSFSMVLDSAMKPVLRNSEGKEIKALPEAKQGDDPTVIKECKAQFATSKKELKQVIDLQTARLFEAMCTGRLWPETEWREYLYLHPIVGRLIQRLVWLEVDANGATLQSFRASDDGSLLNTQDDEVSLETDSSIRIAHASLVSADSAMEWQKHFKDYKLQPLFAQMARTAPALAFVDEKGRAVTEISDRLGWVSDAFSLRGAFNKLGYQRAQAEDGGVFYQYRKDFSSVGVRVVIEFSGNCLPEENVAAALKTLAFEDCKARGWSDRNLALSKVPAVLLAEAYADYLAVANSCAGFDPDWEKKMPW